jgi:hypothetical protein
VPSAGYGRGRIIAYGAGVAGALAAAYFVGGHRQIELHPNAGGFWPGKTDFGDARTHMRNEGIYGLKAGAFLDPNIQLEGNFGYINHFEPRDIPIPLDTSFGVTPKTIYGLLFDLNGVWNFGQSQVFGNRVSPYVTAGVGGLTAEVRHANSALVAGSFYSTSSATAAPVLSNGRTIVLNDGDTFLTVNYGGGVKAMNLWGPMGLRADVRGRTLPNFYGKAVHWPEVTGGLTFSWGER